MEGEEYSEVVSKGESALSWTKSFSSGKETCLFQRLTAVTSSRLGPLAFVGDLGLVGTAGVVRRYCKAHTTI